MATGWLPVLAMLAVLSSGPGGQGVDGQLTEPGICPFSSPLSEWSEEQFVSRPWYEVKAFAVPGLHDSVTGPSCTRWHLTPSEDGMGLHARLAYRAGDDDGVVHGFAQYTSKEKYPRFNFTLRDLGGSGLTRSVDMKLVATDYDNFALLWGCSEPNLFERKVVSWVLSRDPVLSEGAEETLRTLFRRHDIRAEKFVHTDHRSCGAAAGAAYFTDVTTFPNLMEENQQDSVFASFRNADADTLENQRLEDRMLNSADSVNSQPLDGDLVSWSYIGADSGSYLSPQVMLVAVVLAFAAVSLIASLLTFRAVLQRRAATKPVLPVRRQDIVVATLGSGVDYSRFGGLGQGLVQTRKHGGGGDSSLSRPRP